MFCVSCGRDMSAEDRFCARCGRSAEGASTASSPPQPRQLYRSMRDKMLAGVCSGWAHYLGIDVSLMRLIWVGTTFFTGAGLFAFDLPL